MHAAGFCPEYFRRTVIIWHIGVFATAVNGGTTIQLLERDNAQRWWLLHRIGDRWRRKLFIYLDSVNGAVLPEIDGDRQSKA